MGRPKKPPQPCTEPSCDRDAYALSLCRGHYAQQSRGQPIRPLRDRTAGPMVSVTMRWPSDDAEWMRANPDRARAAIRRAREEDED